MGVDCRAGNDDHGHGNFADWWLAMIRKFSAEDESIIKKFYISHGWKHCQQLILAVSGIERRHNDLYIKAVGLGVIKPTAETMDFRMPKTDFKWPSITRMLKCD